MEQYARQQQQLRERRQQRMEAEAAAAAGESPEEAARRERARAERLQFESLHAEALAIFNSHLFPPGEYQQRKQASRADGYWKYVGAGEEPPLDFTYGEFPLPLFSRLVDRACELAGVDADRSGTIFADLGSGAGRLALWAAATSAWRRVVGIEYLPSLAAAASAKLDDARTTYPQLLRTADVRLVQGSWDEPLDEFVGVDVAFAYTTAITTDENNVLAALSAALVPRLRRGMIVVTTDYTLDPAHFEVLESMEGENEGVGGISTGFIHRKICAGERDGAHGSAGAGAFVEEAAALQRDLMAFFLE